MTQNDPPKPKPEILVAASGNFLHNDDAAAIVSNIPTPITIEVSETFPNIIYNVRPPSKLPSVALAV